MDQPVGDAAPDFSPSTALWCPYCRRPFIGSVSLTDGHFVHAACGNVAALDIERVAALATEGSKDAWFWGRYLARLRGDGQEGDTDSPRPTRSRGRTRLPAAAASSAGARRTTRLPFRRAAEARRLD